MAARCTSSRRGPRGPTTCSRPLGQELAELRLLCCFPDAKQLILPTAGGDACNATTAQLARHVYRPRRSPPAPRTDLRPYRAYGLVVSLLLSETRSLAYVA